MAFSSALRAAFLIQISGALGVCLDGSACQLNLNWLVQWVKNNADADYCTFPPCSIHRQVTATDDDHSGTLQFSVSYTAWVIATDEPRNLHVLKILVGNLQ